MKKITKLERQRVLRSILETGRTGNQAHLLRELRRKGIVTTQATISRDLREMGYAKVSLGPGAVRYEAVDRSARGGLRERLRILFETFVLDIRGTGNLLLVITSPGNAHGVASLIDALRKPEILGTVAGDDTILIVVDNQKNRLDLEREFMDLR